MSDAEKVQSPRIGVDEWVERSSERIEETPGLLGALRRRWRAIPFGWQLACFVALGACLPLLTGSDFAIRVGTNTLLLALLALGLNVVVGWAGLFDLGYVAFYGFGAYAYALLASEQIGVHLASPLALAIIVPATALLGLLLGLPSRRLIGDYLAIVTLFFGQVFVELALNLNRVSLPGSDEPIDLTGGPNGIAGVDPLSFFGIELVDPTDYYLFSLVVVAGLIAVLHLIEYSRVGRAWQAIREDPLAASFMSIPVDRLKLLAFACGAAIAGLAGAVFAAVQIGAFPQNFETPILILIYAAVILGGAGSIPGVVIGAVVMSVSLELLRDGDQATALFYLVVIGLLLVRVRPWPRLAAVAVGLLALGLGLHALLAEIAPSAVAGEPHAPAFMGPLLDHWLVVPETSEALTNWAFVVLVLAGLALTRVHGVWRAALLVPFVYLAAFTWENRLLLDPSVTRQLVLGAMLIVVMNMRPRGLFGSRKVEIA